MVDRNDLTDGVTTFARDAAYVVVGLGVLGYQRVQVHRASLERKLGGDLQLEERLGGIRTAVAQGARRVDDVVEGAVHLVETTIQPLEEQLPSSARDLAEKAHSGACQVRDQLRDLMGGGPARPAF